VGRNQAAATGERIARAVALMRTSKVRRQLIFTPVTLAGTPMTRTLLFSGDSY
jgi:hypothetical protein